jgi:F-type H+-transporting ATPase subunit gamma
MSQTIASLDRKIKVAADLQKVVRTMKAMAASSIGQYEKSMHSSSEYYRTVELGLGLCLRKISRESILTLPLISERRITPEKIGMVIFGSDQGLVGQFNNVVASYAINTLKELPGHHRIWTIGERVGAYLENIGLSIEGTFTLPKSVKAITPLVSEILIDTNADDFEGDCDELYLVYNHRTSVADYEPKSLRLLPLDNFWQRDLIKCQWPNKNLPEVITAKDSTLKSLIREYLFVSIFRSCTESLASENVSRLLAMQRADKNIEELLANLRSTFHRLRQGNIDEELFDVVSGFEALSKDIRNDRKY